jgi:Major intrinsic protein
MLDDNKSRAIVSIFLLSIPSSNPPFVSLRTLAQLPQIKHHYSSLQQLLQVIRSYSRFKMDPKLARVPTMYINDTDTTLGRVDPLKGALRGLFNGLPKPARGHVVAVLGEFIGTLSFVFFAFAGVQVGAASSNKDQGVGVSTAASAKSPQLLLYASLAAGFSLVVHAWTFFRISGGLFNPVVC